ncbi:hypothetical protein [Streptomyces sp. NPDC003006]
MPSFGLGTEAAGHGRDPGTAALQHTTLEQAVARGTPFIGVRSRAFWCSRDQSIVRRTPPVAACSPHHWDALYDHLQDQIQSWKLRRSGAPGSDTGTGTD